MGRVGFTLDKLCKFCNKKFTVSGRGKNRKFCSMDCANKYRIGEGNPFYGKRHTIKTKVKQRNKKLGKATPWMLGENNPMKNEEISKKVKNTIRNQFKNGRRAINKGKKNVGRLL